VNIRDEDTRLTRAEEMVYAAAFAAAYVMHTPSSTLDKVASAWRAVMHLRDDVDALKKSIDWDRAEAMYRSFKAIGRE
jgi:hypothetical protein